MRPRSKFPGKPEKKFDHRINEMIRVPKVRLVDENGKMVGEVDTDTARQMARERDLDLVEVAPDARPPVCKILNYGKFKYEEKKRKKGKGHTHQQELKEIRLRPRTDEHDLDTKLKKAREFLEEGDKVLFTVVFRGREQAHKEFGRAMMVRIAQTLEDVAKVEHDVSSAGNRMHLTLLPKPGAKKPEPKPSAPKPEPAAVATPTDAPPAGEPGDGASEKKGA